MDLNEKAQISVMGRFTKQGKPLKNPGASKYFNSLTDLERFDLVNKGLDRIITPQALERVQKGADALFSTAADQAAQLLGVTTKPLFDLAKSTTARGIAYYVKNFDRINALALRFGSGIARGVGRGITMLERLGG
jgi:hypothetical protein